MKVEYMTNERRKKRGPGTGQRRIWAKRKKTERKTKNEKQMRNEKWHIGR